MWSEKGQTLIELIVVIAVIIVVVAALTFATIASLRNANFSQNQAQATKLAQEGLEKVRILRDRDTTGAGIWSTANAESIPPGFRRQFFIEDIGVDQKKVTVVVTWIDVFGPHESRLTTILRKL